MSNGILGIGTSALLAFQQSLNTVSNNIANANTPGYTREQTQLGTQSPQFIGGHYVGRGVQVTGVSRSVDQFLNQAVTTYTSSSSQTGAFSNIASQVDNLLSNNSSGLSSSLQSFFNAWQTLSTDPTSTAARQSVISQAQALSSQMNAVTGQLNAIRKDVNGSLTNDISSVNQIASNIASLNKQIMSQQGQGAQAPNNLLDQRDSLLNKLAKMVAVQTHTESNGALDVTIGTGQSLVTGTTANTLTTKPIGNTTNVGIYLATPSPATNITNQIQGGKLGGLLSARSQLLDSAQNGLGRLAIAVSQQVNAQQAQGFDLNGHVGGNLFKDLSTVSPGAVHALSSNTGTAGPGNFTVTVNASSNLTTSDYVLKYGSSGWSLSNAQTGQAVTLNPTGTANQYSADGLTITVPSSGVNSGDQFLVQPTRDAAANMGVTLTDPSGIAAAGSTTNASGQTVSLGPGDNTNARAVANLVNASVANQVGVNGGNTSFSDGLSQLVTGIGTKTQAATASNSTQQALLQQAQQSQQSVSGVNLNEEAANMLKYQQSYQAAAKLISTSSSLFQSLLNAT